MVKTVAAIIAYLAALLVPLNAVSQAPPDEEDIFRRIVDSESPYYYPSLLLRYTTGDTTLTEKDYYYLYYGYAFSDEYAPLHSIAAEDRVLMAFERAHADPTPENMAQIIRYASEVMKQDPFSPSNINFLAYAYGALGDTLNERINSDRLAKILSAIEASGTGLTEKTPMHVLRFSHANDVLGTFGLSVAKRLVVSKSTEYITVEDEEGRRLNKGYYFDFSRIYRNMQQGEGDSERRWKINDYPLGEKRNK